MTKTHEKNHEEPSRREAANQEGLESKFAASTSPEGDDQDRFDLADVNAILSPTTQAAASGRKPLFRR